MLSILNNNNKPYVQFITSGFSGCRFFRCTVPCNAINWVEGLNVHCIEVPMPLLDNGILNATRAFVFKSPGNAVCYNMVKQLYDIKDKAGFKLFADYDDQPIYIRDSIGLPWEPWGKVERKPEDDHWFKDMAPMWDGILVTNEFLATELNKITNTNNYVVIPNTVPRSMFSAPRKPHITEDKTKFKVIGTGCPLHSLGPHKDEHGNDIEGNPGDWASAEWVEFIKMGVTDGWMEYTQMGNTNWLLKDIQEKIRTVPWVPPYRYGSFYSRFDADVVLAPLVPCVFNSCKSDLRVIEANVNSSVIMASSFDEGPYEYIPELCRIEQGMTANQLRQRLFEIGKVSTWNSIVDWGWSNLLDNGRISESDQAIDRYIKLFGTTPDKIVPVDIM